MIKASIDGQIDKEEYLKMTYYKFVQLDKLLDDVIFDINLRLGKRISSDYKFDSQDVLFKVNKKVFDKICLLAYKHLDEDLCLTQKENES
jgi:hypothetical protein